MLVSNFIKTGRVMFPSQGAEQLINQIVNFGVEKHDDLADALSILILDFIENPVFWARIMFI
jgi:phage terminase large subunit-like protein